MPATGWSYFKKGQVYKALGVMHKDNYWTKEFTKRLVIFNSTAKLKQFLDNLKSGYKEEDAVMQVSGFEDLFFDLCKLKKNKKEFKTKPEKILRSRTQRLRRWKQKPQKRKPVTSKQRNVDVLKEARKKLKKRNKDDNKKVTAKKRMVNKKEQTVPKTWLKTQTQDINDLNHIILNSKDHVRVIENKIHKPGIIEN